MTRRGDVWRRDDGAAWQAWRWDPDKRRWMRRSTGCLVQTAAKAVAIEWLRQGELMEQGLAPPGAEHAHKPLKSHIDDFIDTKRNDPKRLRPSHITNTRRCIDRVVGLAGWTSISQVSLDGLAKVLAGIRLRNGKAPSNGSLNHYRAAWKAFTSWAHKNGRLASDPLAAMRSWSKRGSETRVRRSLTDDELRRLIAELVGSEPRMGMSWPDRTILYLFAVSTGFRKAEIGSLEVGSFVLSARPPHVRLAAAHSKNRKPVDQPLPASLVRELERWLAGRPRTERAWPTLGANTDTASMLRADLLAAGVMPVDGEGRRLDFHALRHTFITRLARAGVSPQAAQKLARHSDINLTMGFYTHLANAELAAELDGRVDPVPCGKRADETADDGTRWPSRSQERGAHAAGDAVEPADGKERNDMEERKLGEWAGPDSNRGLVDYEPPVIDSESTDGATVAHNGSGGRAENVHRRPGHARDRAEAGMEPDLDSAFNSIASYARSAMAGGGR